MLCWAFFISPWWENLEEKRWDCKLGSAFALSILGKETWGQAIRQNVR